MLRSRGTGPFFLLDSKLPNEKQNCARDDEQFANVRAAQIRNQVQLLQVIRWNFSVRVKPNKQSAEYEKVPLLFWFNRVFQKSGAETPWNDSVICETYLPNWQTESHRMKQDVELHLMVQ